MANLRTATATSDDAPELAALHAAVAADLARRYGPGPWEHAISLNGVTRAIETSSAFSKVLVAREDAEIVGTLRLQTKKPWAIDASYFSPARRPLYLLDMAVRPDRQRHGIGRRLLAAADDVSRNWPGDAIRLDAYDAPAGAGGFYAWCGYREVGRVSYRGNPLVYFERLL